MTGTSSRSRGAALVRWPSDRAVAWAADQPWLVGCNYVPSTAVNTIEQWQAATFDEATIARELGWAAGLGFNTVRVFLPFRVWEADRAGFLARCDRFLALAAGHGLAVLPVLFDDCAFSCREPVLGPQPAPIPGVHNSGWTASPGAAVVRDRAAWPRCADYVRALVGAFAADRRVLAWDVYNEPGNAGLGLATLPFLNEACAWTRAAAPRQPLTVAAWTWDDALRPLAATACALSDVYSLHQYDTWPRTAQRLDAVPADRPCWVTEWLARPLGSTVATHLDQFRQRGTACWCWGLVAGRTQTIFPWGSPAGAPEPELWFHDLFHADGTPYRAEEAALIRRITGIAAGVQAATRA